MAKIWVLLLLVWTAAASGVHAATGIELLSGVGYKSSSEGPTLLLGAEWSAYDRQGSFFTGLQETEVGLHASDVFSVDSLDNTVTLGLDGNWTRTQGPLSFSLGGQAFFRRQGETSARTVGLNGVGRLGRISGQFRADYIENPLATFPWYQRDLDGVTQAGTSPFYRAHVGVSALVIPKYGLHWSQDVKWRRPVDDRAGTINVSTGPEVKLGPGMAAVQGGILMDEQGIRPMWQVRYQLRPVRPGVDFEVTASTLSLDGSGPVLYGWLGVDGDRLGIGAALRLEKTPDGDVNPAVYFSLHPKF